MAFSMIIYCTSRHFCPQDDTNECGYKLHLFKYASYSIPVRLKLKSLPQQPLKNRNSIVATRPHYEVGITKAVLKGL